MITRKMRLVASFVLMIYLLCVSLVCLASVVNRFANQQNAVDDVPTSLALSTTDFGFHSPINLGVNYNTLTGFYSHLTYSSLLNHVSAYALIAEYGPSTYRINGTVAASLAPSVFIKLSAERLSERLPFRFQTGRLYQRLGQNALGAEVNYVFLDSSQQVNAGAYYAYVNNVLLRPIQFTSSSSQCNNGGSGYQCVNERHIAGGKSLGLHMGVETIITPYIQLSSKLFYDRIRYETLFVHSNANAHGLGMSLRFEALLSNNIKGFAEAEIRKIYNLYTEGIMWKSRPYLALETEIAFIAQQQMIHNATPNSHNLSLQFSFDLSGLPHANYSLFNPPVEAVQLEQWTKHPAVYMARVLAIGEEKMSLQAARILTITPNVGPLDGGNTVTILGVNFLPQARVFFGTQEALILNNNINTINVVVPPGMHSGFVDVIVLNSYSERIVASMAYRYDNVLTPQITGVSPSSGVLTGAQR